MHFIFLMLVLFGIGCDAVAKEISLDTAVSYAVSNSSIATRIKADTANKFADEIDDSTLQNPQAQFTYRADNSSEVSINQPLRVSDILLTRYNYKRFLLQLRTIEEKLDLLRIYHETENLYYGLYIKQELLIFMQRQLKLSDTIQQNLNQSIYSELTQAELDVLKAENKILKGQIKQLEKTISLSKLNFIQQVGLTQIHISLSAPPIELVSVSDAVIFSKLDAYPNQKEVLKLQYEQSLQQLEILKKDRWMPVISPSVGYGIRSFEKQDDWNVGIGISIPLWNYSTHKINATKAQVKSYETTLTALDRISFNDVVKTQYDLLSEVDNQLKVYQKDILPTLRQATQKMEISFKNGSVSALDLLQVLEKEQTAYSVFGELLLDGLQVKSELEMLIGT